MEQQMVQEKPKLGKLKAGIQQLIAEYRHARDLLNNQMQAVINNDISSLDEMLHKQVSMYDTLKQSELKFKNQLQAFHQNVKSEQTVSLGDIIANLNIPANRLNDLRNRLRKDVEKTEKLRQQLMNLLQFAQQQNAEVFKAICSISEDNSEAYDASGKKQANRANGIAINRQA